MGNGFQFLDVIIFAAIAAFLVLRLRGVLGKRTGHQRRSGYDPFQKDNAEDSNQDKVIPLPDRAADADQEAPSFDSEADAAEAGASADGAGLTKIKLAQRDFDSAAFLNGARVAFETILNAFAQGETRSLRPLLSNDVYEDFASAIKAREQANQTLETTLVGFSEAEIIDADLQGKTAFITTKFVTEQVNLTRDADGNVIDGDPNQVTTITDIWTFARNTRSRDPNWTLVATRSNS